MKEPAKQSTGQSKIEFVLLIGSIFFALLGFIGLISPEWRGYVQKWILRW